MYTFFAADISHTPMAMHNLSYLFKGKAMEAQIPQRWLETFAPRLKEGSVYYFKYFQVCDARANYRPVDHPYMMKFTAYTKIFEVKTVADNFPRYAYNIATYEVLRQRIGIIDFCSGMIEIASRIYIYFHTWYRSFIYYFNQYKNLNFTP